MTIDEAIVHAREVASRKFDDRVHCIRCAEEHEQLAEWLEELKQYRAIGTLEECREAVEKQTDEKPTAVLGTFGGKEYECKNCGSDVCYGDEYCRWCGQKLDWSDQESLP